MVNYDVEMMRSNDKHQTRNDTVNGRYDHVE